MGSCGQPKERKVKNKRKKGNPASNNEPSFEEPLNDVDDWDNYQECAADNFHDPQEHFQDNYPPEDYPPDDNYPPNDNYTHPADNGYPPENYTNTNESHDWQPDTNSYISSQSSHNTTNGTGSSGNRSPRRNKRRRRLQRPHNNQNNDFNGLLTDDDVDNSWQPPPSNSKPGRRATNLKFKPKKGQVWLWNTKDVFHWIQHLGDVYREYAVEFEDHAVDGRLLLQMDNNDYHELGVVSPLHVKKIQVELDRLIQQHKNKPKSKVPESVIMSRSELSESTIRMGKRKKKKKRPKKQAVMAFPSQYAMYPNASGMYPNASMQRYEPSVSWVPSTMPRSQMRPLHMQRAMPPMNMPMNMPMNFQLCPIYE